MDDDTNLMASEPVEEVAGEGVGYSGGVATAGYVSESGQGSYNDSPSDEIVATPLPLGGSLTTPGMAAVYAQAPSVAQEDVNLSTGSVNWGSTGNFFSNLLSSIGKALGTESPSPSMPGPSGTKTTTSPTTASTVAATIKKNWLPLLALAIVGIVGAVLIFRRKR
jgi:hypothetical protein